MIVERLHITSTKYTDAERKQTHVSYENEKEFLSKIDLSDGGLLIQFKLAVMVVKQKEEKKLLAFLRMEGSLTD